MVMTPDWQSIGCEFKYRNFSFSDEKLSLISVILNTKSEKHDWFPHQSFMRTVWYSSVTNNNAPWWQQSIVQFNEEFLLFPGGKFNFQKRPQINQKQNRNDEWIVTGSAGDVQMKITFTELNLNICVCKCSRWDQSRVSVAFSGHRRRSYSGTSVRPNWETSMVEIEVLIFLVNI